MPRPDIILGDQETRAVGRVEVGVGESEDPDIDLNPDSASVRLGGGDGEYSEGDLRLADKEGNVRIHASAGEGRFDLETTRVLFRGDDGSIELGADGVRGVHGNENADVMILTEQSELHMGGGGSNSAGRIDLDNKVGYPRIRLRGEKEEDSPISAPVEIVGEDALMEIGTIDIRGDEPMIEVGGGETTGTIWVNSSSDDGTGILRLHGGTPPHTDPLMGDLGVRLYGDAASAFLGGPGQEGSVHLWHADENWDKPDEERTSVAYVLRATEQGFEVADSDGNTTMQIDTDGTVRVKDGEVKPLN